VKPLTIEFVEQRPSLLLIWFSILFLLCIGGFTAWRYFDLTNARNELLTKNGALELQIKALDTASRQAEPTAADLKNKTEASQLAILLQRDLNKPLSALENLKITGVRLRSLNIDNSQNSVEVEFELPSLEHASQLTESLGMGYANNPWQFQNAGLLNTLSPNNSLTSTRLSYSARWRAKLSDL
jgi:hypothetical protein